MQRVRDSFPFSPLPYSLLKCVVVTQYGSRCMLRVRPVGGNRGEYVWNAVVVFISLLSPISLSPGVRAYGRYRLRQSRSMCMEGVGDNFVYRLSPFRFLHPRVLVCGRMWIGVCNVCGKTVAIK